MSEPQYKIYGIERRRMKARLSRVKSFVRNFWHFHQLDKDMASLYGGSDGYPMSDKLARKKFDEAKKEITGLEKKLNTPYNIEK